MLGRPENALRIQGRFLVGNGVAPIKIPHQFFYLSKPEKEHKRTFLLTQGFAGAVKVLRVKIKKAPCGGLIIDVWWIWRNRNNLLILEKK
jgi:hypothetical protein